MSCNIPRYWYTEILELIKEASNVTSRYRVLNEVLVKFIDKEKNIRIPWYEDVGIVNTRLEFKPSSVIITVDLRDLNATQLGELKEMLLELIRKP